MPRKEFQIGEVLTAANVNTFLMDQAVMSFDDDAARGSAIPTPVEGMATFRDDEKAVEVYANGNWNTVSQAISPNYIINGAFDVWQRGTATTSFEFGTFITDRFSTGYNTGGGSRPLGTISRQPFTPSDLAALGFGEGQHFFRVGISDPRQSTAGVIAQAIEDVRTLAGQVVTLSFYGRVSSGTKNVNMEISQGFGVGGSASVSVIAATVSLNTSWQRFTATTTLGGLSGKTIGVNSGLSIILGDLQPSAVNFDIWGVQLEAGSVATPFKRHAPSLQGELAACQRYYYRQSENTARLLASSAFTQSTTKAVGFGSFPVPMRIRPTSLLQSGTASDYRITNTAFSNFTCSVVPAYEASTTNRHYAVVFEVASGLTANQPAVLRQNTTDGFLAWDVEL